MGRADLDTRAEAVEDDAAHLALQDADEVGVFAQVLRRAVNRGGELTVESLGEADEIGLGRAFRDDRAGPKDFVTQMIVGFQSRQFSAVDDALRLGSLSAGGGAGLACDGDTRCLGDTSIPIHIRGADAGVQHGGRRDLRSGIGGGLDKGIQLGTRDTEHQCGGWCRTDRHPY